MAKAKASQLLGKRAEKPFKFQHPDGEPVDVLLRPLTGLEEAQAIEHGMKFARSHGLEDADYGSALFDIGIRAFEVFTATLDVDSPENARESFFPSVEYVTKEYHPDTIIYAHQAWKLWHEECSPLMRVHTPRELVEASKHMARDDDDFLFFSRQSPRTQASLARFTARLAQTSPEIRSFDSLPTGDSVDSGTGTTQATKAPEPKP